MNSILRSHCCRSPLSTDDDDDDLTADDIPSPDEAPMEEDDSADERDSAETLVDEPLDEGVPTLPLMLPVRIAVEDSTDADSSSPFIIVMVAARSRLEALRLKFIGFTDLCNLVSDV